MISDYIKNIIDIFLITPYEETIITKLKYGYKIKDKDKIYLYIINKKLELANLKYIRGKI